MLEMQKAQALGGNATSDFFYAWNHDLLQMVSVSTAFSTCQPPCYSPCQLLYDLACLPPLPLP